MLLNGVETIQVAPKFNDEYGEEIVQTTISEQVMLKIACIKTRVVRKTEVLKGTRGSNPLASAKYGEVTSAAWRPILKIVCTVKGMGIDTSLLRDYDI